jgi:transketolase
MEHTIHEVETQAWRGSEILRRREKRMAKPDEIRRIEKIAWDLRADVVRMIGVGKAGHLGGSCSLAEIVAALYFAKMRFDPKALGDPSRDRFLLSKGHSVLIQYAALVQLGVIPREELEKLKTLAGKLQGHPDMMTPGMEAVTGSLGQGLSIAVGMALALRLAKSPSRVYVIMGDGELAEGQLWEAAMAASRYKLDSLTGILDRNRVQATGPTKEIFDIPDIAEKWRAFGWNVLSLDGHDVGAVLDALDGAAAKKGVPTVIVADTVKGKGVSFAENSAAFHNAAMTQEQYDKALLEIEESRRRVQ